MVTNYWLYINHNTTTAVGFKGIIISTQSNENKMKAKTSVLNSGYNFYVLVRVFPQASAPSNVPGPTVARSSPGQTSWRVTTARTRARSASTAHCVTSASWGATTWQNTPGDMRASIPACCRAPVQPRDAAAPRRCLPLTLETGVLPGCEAHPLTVHINTEVHVVNPEAYMYIDAPTCVVFTFWKKSCQVRHFNQPNHYRKHVSMHETLCKSQQKRISSVTAV